MTDARSGAQQLADLVPAAQVAGELGAVVAQPAEVDDTARAGLLGRPAEAHRRAPLEVGEVGALAHRVDQVERRVHPGEGGAQGGRLQQIALAHLHLRRNPRERARSSSQTTHPVAGVQEAGQQPATDIAGGASEQHRARHVAFPLHAVYRSVVSQESDPDR
jgi:hypothetical protein